MNVWLWGLSNQENRRGWTPMRHNATCACASNHRHPPHSKQPQRKIQEIKAPFATNAGRCSSKLKKHSACWIQTNQDQPNFWHDGSLSQETCHEWSQISTQKGCMPSAETWVRVERQNVKRSTRMPCTPKSGSAPTPFSRSPLEPHRLQKSQMLHDSTKTMPAPAFCE